MIYYNLIKINHMKNVLILLFSLFLSTHLIAEDAPKKNAKILANKDQIMAEALQELKATNIMAKAPKLGDTLPDGQFLNLTEETTLYKLLGDKPAIITFYRGEWCPYCNVQLQSYSSKIKEINELGANLIAISPELPESSSVTIKKGDLKFSILSDVDNKYAKNLGIVFKINEELKELYGQFGIDLDKNQGNHSWELPLAATFIVDKDKKITYSFIEVDYKKRAKIEDLLEELENSNK